MPKKLTQEEFIQKAKVVHGDTYDYSKVVYEKSSKKIVIICPKHGEFEQTPNNHLSGRGCPTCKGGVSCDRDGFIEKAKEIHGDRYDYGKVVYVNAKTKVEIICPEHGSFWQMPDKHTNEGCGCPVCAGNIAYDKDAFVAAARGVHGDRYAYDKVVYKNNKTKVVITCPEHGDFEQTPDNHLHGKGCPVCAGNVARTRDQFVDAAALVHGDKYDYSKVVYKNNKAEIEIVCPKHGVFWQSPEVHLTGCGCPKCGIERRSENWDGAAQAAKQRETCLQKYGVPNPMYDTDIREKQLLSVQSEEARQKSIETKKQNGTTNTSKPEEDLYDTLKLLFAKDDVVRGHNTDARYPHACDFYIRSLDLFIELNGHWTHGGHWYNADDKADTVKAALWRQKGDDVFVKTGKKSAYSVGVEVWTDRDVKKREDARKHDLNYAVFWKCDLSDVKDWIDDGCPIRKDWK